MRFIHLFQTLGLFCFLVITGCNKSERKEYYCNFDFRLLKPTSNCVENLKVFTTYNQLGFSSFIYKMNNDTLKKDTVIYYDGKMYLFSNSLYANALRIATRISGISTVFVFKKMKSFYKLSLIETYYWCRGIFT